MSGCRMCRTCTSPGLPRLGLLALAGTAHLGTAGVSWAAKRGLFRHCPRCRHLERRHVPGDWLGAVDGS